MKKFAFSLTLSIMAMFASLDASGQSIQIDSMFLSSCQIYPFENIELVSELTIEGEIELNSDTSLVRVILEDDSGFQYMVFEAFPVDLF